MCAVPLVNPDRAPLALRLPENRISANLVGNADIRNATEGVPYRFWPFSVGNGLRAVPLRSVVAATSFAESPKDERNRSLKRDHSTLSSLA